MPKPRIKLRQVQPLTDKEYFDIMERVAEDNWKLWGDDSADAAFLRTVNSPVYNYRAYYNKYPKSRATANTHWPDEFKTVYHPTFSNESVYSGNVSQYNPLGLQGGTWNGEVFVPSTDQLKHYLRYAYKYGGIHIKPENRGKFTETMRRTGKTAEELSHSSNPLTRKRAIFALNARKWNH